MADFTQAFEVNTTACFYTLVAFLSLLGKGNESEVSRLSGVKSQFIVTGSIGAMSRRPGMGFAYAGSKMAVSLSPLILHSEKEHMKKRRERANNEFLWQMIHIVKQLSTMLADWRLDIRANCFCPGVYPSDMSKVCFNLF